MRIGDQSPIQPTSSVAKAAPTPATGPKAAMAKDSVSLDASPVNVVSFNVAGGASAFKLEDKLVDATVFQKLLKGDPDAPVMALQETTPALAKKLMEEAKKSGNFEVVYPGQAWLPKFVPISPLMQGNMILVPKRYKVEHTEAKTFTGRAKAFFSAVKNVLFHHAKPNDLILAMQNRGYVTADLKDTKTGKTFSVVATHVAYQDSVRRVETPQLVDVLKKAQAKGPTIFMGDVNIPTLESKPDQNEGAKDFWKAFEPFGLKDMGPSGKDGASFWGNGANIDVVLTSGFKSVSSEMLTGNKNVIPGKTDAKEISDHWAESDTIAFE